MLAKSKILEILHSYNIYSQKYEPTVYENKSDLGLCIDIKDSLFGYLTRIFLFNTENELSNFLKEYYWYKENHQKYQITLKLDSYDTKNPKIIYKYKDQNLTLDNMLNMESVLEAENNKKEKETEKRIYLAGAQELTNYLINLRQQKENTKLEKNKLKTEENDLKFALLQDLTTYYGREKAVTKKQITLENPTPVDNTLLLENLKNIQEKNITEIKEYLTSLINGIKTEELEEKYLVNLYSNQVYTYNIDILKKQIDFVKSKINAEKNFNLKGSKIHNIDEELKSFLKTNTPPAKIEVFLIDIKDKIENKFKNITDLKNASLIITGNSINIEPSPKEVPIDVTSHLIQEFNNLPKETQASLILYNSIYKPLCNYIINNNYPDPASIFKEFDFNYYYNELEEIVFNENNNHYLIHYFSQINFKDSTSYLNSIINICKIVENTLFTIPKSLTLFASEEQNKYKHLTIYPNELSKYLITTNNQILFIPYKLNIDRDTLEITILNSSDYYTNEKIVKEEDYIVLAKYNKKQILKDGIIITTDLLLESNITFNKSHLEGENYG